jgi:hypothetical protein
MIIQTCKANLRQLHNPDSLLLLIENLDSLVFLIDMYNCIICCTESYPLFFFDNSPISQTQFSA